MVSTYLHDCCFCFIFLSVVVTWLALQATSATISTTSSDFVLAPTAPMHITTSHTPFLMCICSINVSEGRSLECRHYQTEELLYLSRSNILLRETSCDRVTTLAAKQPTRIHVLRPDRLLQLKHLISLRLLQVGLRNSFKPDALRGLSSLEELELVGPHNLLRLEAHSFQHTPVLKRLVLQDNEIEVIDRFAFCEADNLEFLDLSRNRIVTYSCDWFPGLMRLNFLNITLLLGFDAVEGDLTRAEPYGDPPDCLFCPLASLSQLSFNTWDLDSSRRYQALRYAINRHYQLALQGPLVYNVTGLRPHGACGVLGSDSAAVWQQCQRWRDGKPVSARYVTLPTSKPTTSAGMQPVPAREARQKLNATDHQNPRLAVLISSSTISPTASNNSSSGDEKSSGGLLGSFGYLVLIAAGLALLAVIILVVICIACCCASHRGVRYSVKDEAAAAASARGTTNGSGL